MIYQAGADASLTTKSDRPVVHCAVLDKLDLVSRHAEAVVLFW